MEFLKKTTTSQYGSPRSNGSIGRPHSSKIKKSHQRNKYLTFWFRESQLNSTDLWNLLLLTFFALATRFWRLFYPAAVVFDEFHFGKFVTWYFKHQYYFDIHPPLGKLILYLGGLLGGYNPGFLYDAIGAEYGDTKFQVLRSVSALFGVLSVPLMYLTCRELDISSVGSFAGASMVLLDFLSLIESRLILVDSQLLFFCMASFYSALKLWKCKKENCKRSFLFFLVLTGLLCGCAISVKWTALATPGIIAIVSFFGLHFLKEPLEIWECLIAGLSGIFVYLFVFYVHFQLLPYSGSGDAFMTPEFQKTLIGNPFYHPAATRQPFLTSFFQLNREMFRANKGIKDRHPWESKWYEWPLNLRGLLYFVQEDDEDESRMSQIYLIGNPAVMYLCLLSALTFLLCAIFFGRYRYTISSKADVRSLMEKGCILCGAYALNLLPYVAVERSAFLYHYIPGLFYAELLTALVIDKFPKSYKFAFIIVILILEVVAFVYWAPWVYAISLTKIAHDKRRWLPRWN
ncbi:hypothetical protein GpartN1_g2229.t1 [Galdieria partita]|uniref:Dolichyl-phosphate-mannose--protein mannosyltransferase n=1 Tax=Galdieria partita TaxID=83374 RepID=A0A9C7PTJ1_9RHOD|nr:hypothetical protein GpartN1_g2229.t1 [Galdieria partita]